MKNTKTITKIILLLCLIVVVSSLVLAQPTGLDITSNATETAPAVTPDNRTDDGGTINTLMLDAVQQNSRWKAYIGNITGQLSLDDASGNTIFNWILSKADTTGEIYASRSNGVDWGNVGCVSNATISTEETALGMTGTAIDSINRTFNETTHPPITVATTAYTGCRATSTFVNSAREAQGSASFPVVLLHDTTNLIYTTPINPTTAGYDGSTFDFQMITANDPDATTTYYFYAEIGD